MINKELLKNAYLEGKVIQKFYRNKWIDLSHPNFCKSVVYRIKPIQPRNKPLNLD